LFHGINCLTFWNWVFLVIHILNFWIKEGFSPVLYIFRQNLFNGGQHGFCRQALKTEPWPGKIFETSLVTTALALYIASDDKDITDSL
jgi:hypothetical protein